MKKPKKIYKYESFSSQSLRNLKGQSLYFGSPLGFNDPYDCALKAGIKEPTKDEISKFIQYSLNDKRHPQERIKALKNSNDEEIKEMIIKYGEIFLKERTEIFLANNGVTCFSESNKDLLMWSHYGGAYKGFCLEFDTNYNPFSKMKKVVYSEEIPKINAVSLYVNKDFSPIIKNLFCTKSASWKYEKEWRIIHDTAGTLFTYEASALTSIYFGPDIDIESLEIICLILKGQNPNVKLWRGKRSEEKFEVLFEEFFYSSYIESMNNT